MPARSGPSGALACGSGQAYTDGNPVFGGREMTRRNLYNQTDPVPAGGNGERSSAMPSSLHSEAAAVIRAVRPKAALRDAICVVQRHATTHVAGDHRAKLRPRHL